MISILTSQATKNAFNLYSTRSGQIWAARLAPVLADYYLQANSWQGVDAILLSNLSAQYEPIGTGNMMGQGRGYGSGQLSASGMMGNTDQRLVLADANGFVISDTLNEIVGTQISSAELKNGTAITQNNILLGTLIITPNNLTQTGSLAGEFLTSVNHAITSSALIAGAIALLIGAVLFFQITAPLRKLKKAAIAISNGDLTQRVNIRSKDEFGELGITFNQMAENLSNAETQRQQLMADVAHELRTPLTAIQGTLEGMQDGLLPLDDEQLATLHAETTLLNRLIGDLRLLSLAEAGQLKLELQEVEPGGLFQQIVERAKTQALQKYISIESNIQPNLPRIIVDADRITQVLNNLISNAIRYTSENGTITVQSRFNSDAGFLETSVIDTGTGIEANNLPFVFDRFYRADKSRTRSSGGSGLGLAIVKQLIEAHGGNVKVESPVFQTENNLGYGTKFSFSLPVKKPLT
ncbi:MAG: sensor histidine kinase [Anaerolineaceae bacterium]